MRRLLPRYTATLVGAGQQVSLSSSKCSPNAATTTEPSLQSFLIPTWMKNEPHATSSNKRCSMSIFKNSTYSATIPAAFLLNNNTNFSATYLLGSFRHKGGFQDGEDNKLITNRTGNVNQEDTIAATTFWVALVTEPDKKDTWPTDDDKDFKLYLKDVPNDTDVAEFKQLVQLKATPELSHVAAHNLQVFNKDTKEELRDLRAPMGTVKQDARSKQLDVSLYVLHAPRISERGGKEPLQQPSGSGATPQCRLTQEKLYDLRKENNAALPTDRTRIFNQDFVAGTEEDPKCKCGRHIREHLTQQEQLQQQQQQQQAIDKDAIIERFATAINKPKDGVCCLDQFGKAIEGQKEPLVYLLAFQTKRIGAGHIDTELCTIVNELNPGAEGDDRNATAAVILGASGVGKTSAAVAFASRAIKVKGQENRHFLFAYPGFNCKARLTSAEKNHMRSAASTSATDTQKAEEAVGQVLLSRLYGVLSVMYEYSNELGPSKNTDGEEHNDAPFVNFPEELLQKGDLLQVSYDTWKKRVATSFVQLYEKRGSPWQTQGKQLVVCVNVDEAQRLDTHVDFPNEKDPNKRQPWGARLALRVLREVQLEVFERTNKNCIVLPVASGINPDVSLAPAKEYGLNTVVGSKQSMLDKGEFFNVAAATMKRTLERELKEADLLNLRPFCAAGYPRVRPVLEALRKVHLPFYEPIISQLKVEVLPATEVITLMEHAVSPESKLKPAHKLNLPEPYVRANIPSATFHCVGNDITANPILDFSVWGTLIFALSEAWKNHPFSKEAWGTNKLGEQLKFPICDVTLTKRPASDWPEFEKLAFDTLVFIIRLMWLPDLPKTDRFPRLTMKCVRNRFFPEDSILSQALLLVDDSFPTKCEICKFPDATRNYHLFQRKGSTHEEAFKGELSKSWEKGFDAAFNPTTTPAAFWSYCGGSAPVDFILLFSDDKRNLHARYFDGKHVSEAVLWSAGAYTSEVSVKNLNEDAQKMARNATKLHEGLTRALKGKGWTLNPVFTVSLVTNVEEAKETDGAYEIIKQSEIVQMKLKRLGESMRKNDIKQVELEKMKLEKEELEDELKSLLEKEEKAIREKAFRVEKVFLLGPSTFDFFPWTDLLYCRGVKPEEGNPDVRLAITNYLTNANIDDTLYTDIMLAHGKVTVSTLREYLATASTDIGYTSDVIRTVFDAMAMGSDDKPLDKKALSSFIARCRTQLEKDVRVAIAKYLTNANVNTIYAEIKKAQAPSKVTELMLCEFIATDIGYPIIGTVFDALKMRSGDTTPDKKARLISSFIDAFIARCNAEM